MAEPEVFATCNACGQAIRRGQIVVTIARNVEQIGADGNIDEVIDSQALASLCASCGHRYPAHALRIDFGQGPG